MSVRLREVRDLSEITLLVAETTLYGQGEGEANPHRTPYCMKVRLGRLCQYLMFGFPKVKGFAGVRPKLRAISTTEGSWSDQAWKTP